MGIREIEEAIRKLNPDDLARFRQWYQEFDAAVWDHQIEVDSLSGRLDRLAEEATEEYRAGKFKEL
ncbi:MAG: hypothetical protein KIS88_04135 [Anaerolineales bacterium]|nr:hypothetical protein [Anaerolineales bacterium]